MSTGSTGYNKCAAEIDGAHIMVQYALLWHLAYLITDGNCFIAGGTAQMNGGILLPNV